MNLNELIEALQELQDALPDGTEVRLAQQPSWPFEYSVEQVAVSEDEDGNPVVYVAEGNQLGYLSSNAKADLEW